MAMMMFKLTSDLLKNRNYDVSYIGSIAAFDIWAIFFLSLAVVITANATNIAPNALTAKRMN